MRNRVRKRILLSGLVCVLGLLACACGGTEEGPGAGEPDGEAVFVEEPGDEDTDPETPEEPPVMPLSAPDFPEDADTHLA